jgi:cytoskeletal protein CcmA (bactofilin family)
MKTTDYPEHQADDFQHSILRTDIKLMGDLFFSGTLHVFGSITGNIISTKDPSSYLILEEGSHVSGEIRASNIAVHSQVSGNIFAFTRLTLKATAIIQGNVHYNELEIEEGATINGNLSAIDNEKSITSS